MMKPWVKVAPLPALSQLLSVAVGMNAPVRPTQELPPASAVPWITPAVTSAWLAAGAEVTALTKVWAGTPKVAGQ